MRRILSVIVTLIFITCFAQAQNFQLTKAEEEAWGNIGDKIQTVLKVKNTSDKPISLNVKILSLQLASGQSNSFFWGDQFVQPSKGETARSIKLSPGQQEVSLVNILQSGVSESTSSVIFCIFDAQNPADSLVHEITYYVKDEQQTELLFQDRSIKVSNIYPNPVRDKANIDYQLLNANSQAKVVIHNLLGSIVGEFQLDAYSNKITIPTDELNPGVYFYSLHLDKKNVITKKFIIKR